MIFCSVGTQLPFSRLLDYLYRWSEFINKQQERIVIQSGDKVNVKRLENVSVIDFVSEEEFSKYIDECSVVISHAGMGNIIRAIELNKPIVIVPRLSSLNEHRNDHQTDSANRFSSLSNVFVANDFDSFCKAIELVGGYGDNKNETAYPERDKLIKYLNSQISLL
ncbi:glycosyltransferase [Klebsiella aerogenes]|nr:glycosyltransferase [Klebsiella aerogenes]